MWLRMQISRGGGRGEGDQEVQISTYALSYVDDRYSVGNTVNNIIITVESQMITTFIMLSILQHIQMLNH